MDHIEHMNRFFDAMTAQTDAFTRQARWAEILEAKELEMLRKQEERWKRLEAERARELRLLRRHA